MFKRIKLLTLLQLSDRIKINSISDKKRNAVRIAVSILAIVLITGAFSALFYALSEFLKITMDKNIVIFLLFILQILSVISCTNGLLKTLYDGKDNMILLSYPAKHVEVFISKLLVFYIYEFIKSVFLILPLLFSFAFTIVSFNILYVITTLLLVIMLPIYPVLIGALFTIPLVMANRLLKRFPLVKTIFGILLLVLLFIGIEFLVSHLPVPFRMNALFNKFVTQVTDFIVSFNRYALYYRSIGAALAGEDIVINYLIIFGVLLGFVSLIILISMPLYFSLASSSREHANVKVHKGGNKAHTNTFFTFVKKEVLLSVRNFSGFINNYSFLIALPYILYLITSINLAVFKNELGFHLTVAGVGFVSLILASASNTASALAITEEGSEFVLLKTVPANIKNLCWAKIFFNVVFSSFMIILSFLVVQIFCTRFCNNVTLPSGIPMKMEMISALDLWAMCACVLIINLGLILWSFQLDIKNPSLREFASSGDSTSIQNVSLSIKIGLFVTFIFTFIAVFFLIDGGSSILTWSKIMLFSLIFLGLRFYFFRNYLKYIFPRIEY